MTGPAPTETLIGLSVYLLAILYRSTSRIGPCVAGPLLTTPPQSVRSALTRLCSLSSVIDGCSSRAGSKPPIRSYMYQQKEPIPPT